LIGLLQNLIRRNKQFADTIPVIPTIFKLGEMRLSLFAIIAQFGTPEDVALDDVKIELYFPSDAQSDAILQQMAEGA